MQLDHGFGHRKAQPHAAIAPGQVRLHLVKALENTRQLTGRDADPIVCNGNPQIARIFLDTDGDIPSGLRVLDGILDQVAQGDGDLNLVGMEIVRQAAHFGFQGNVLLLRFRLEQGDHIFDDPGQGYAIPLHPRWAAFEIVHIGEIFDDLLQLGCIADDCIQLFAELRAGQLTQEGGMAQDQAQGCPQLVGSNGDEVWLEAFELGQLDLGGPDLARQVHVLHRLGGKRSQGFEESQVFFGIMCVVLFIKGLQHADNLASHHERYSHKGLCLMVRHPVDHIEMALIHLDVLDNQRLTFAEDPARRTPFQRYTHGSQQVAFEPLHRQEAQLLRGLVIFENGGEFAVGQLGRFADDRL